MSAPVKRPPSDRRQLREIIAGLTEGVLLLDTDGRIIWANTAALSAYKVDDLDGLGGTADEFFKRFDLHYRNHHELKAAEFPMARLLAGEAFSDMVVRVTRPGEEAAPRRVHRLRGLVLTTDDDAPDALVLVVSDETERYSAEDRFERTFNANPAPAVICAVDDLRFVKVNQGFLDMTGYERAAVMGRSVYEIDVLENAEARDEAIERLSEWRTIRQMEACLKLPSGAHKPVVVAGQPIELNEARCMLFTFMDLEPRKQAEALLRQSEERFAKAFRLAPVPMVLMTLDGFKILDVNDAFSAVMGKDVPTVIGRTAIEIELWQDGERRRAFEAALRAQATVRNFEARLRVADDQMIDCLISAEVVEIAAQTCVLSVMLDISERKRSEADLVAAIEAVMKDTSWFSQTVIEKLANLRAPQAAAQRQMVVAALTLREREVLEMICGGMTDQEIAAQLGLSRNTVRNHVATLYGKIEVHRRSAAVVWARERGISAYKQAPSRAKK
ncbi:MAG: PAS domain S-box protein [Acidocella sp.]|nr:PAS domain S-box protein [Acidocella sp.]